MIGDIITVLLVIVMGYIAFISSVLVSERKARYKAGTHDYYDNPINRKCMGGEDDEAS